MFSLLTIPREGKRDYRKFSTDTELALYLESLGVPYYGELGYTHMANGTVYEYGRVGH